MEELQQALTDRSLSIIDKLKVACYIWKNTGDTRNMLRWSCDQISSIYKKKSSSNEEYIVQLFKFLSVLLKTYTSVGKWCPDDSVFTVHLFESMATALQVVESEECIKNIIESLQYIMTGSPLPSVLFKFELAVSLLHSLLLNLGTAISVLVSVEPFFRFFVYLLESQGKQKKVFTVTCEELLEPLLKARKVLTADKAVCSPSSTEILAHLDNIIKQVFNKETLAEFPSAISSPDWLTNSPKQTATSFVRVLFTSLHYLSCTQSRKNSAKKKCKVEAVKSQLNDSEVVEGIPYILDTFLLQNRHHQVLPKSTEFKFFLRLFEIITHSQPLLPEQVSIKQESSQIMLLQSMARFLSVSVEDSRSVHSPSSKFQSLAVCLSSLLSYEVYNAGLDGSTGGEQTKFFEGLVQGLLVATSKENMPDILLCLTTLFQLNYKLVEPWLPLIWLYLFDDCLKGEKFTLVCIETYWKLRQLPVLIKTYFESLDLLADALTKHPTILQPSPSFSPAADQLLAKHVTSLPPGQCVEVLDFFLQYFSTKVNIDLCGGTMNEPLVISLVASLEKAADIAGTVLGNIPLSVWNNSRLKEKAMAVLMKLHSEVSLPFLQATYTKKYRRRLSAAALCLNYATSQLLSRLYPFYPDLESTWLPELVWHDELGSFISEAWCHWLPDNREKLGAIRLLLLKKLAILHLKALLRGDCEDSKLLSQVALCVHQPLSEVSMSTAPWTGQIYDLCDENAEVAYWQLLLSSQSLLYPHTEPHLLTTMGVAIVEALNHSEEPIGCGLSVGGVVREFLSSEVFLEMGALHEAILTALLHQEQSVLPKCYPKALRRCLTTASIGEDGFLEQPITDSLSASLDCALHSLESWQGPPPSDKKLRKWLASLSTSLELLEKLPLRYTSPISLQRALLSLNVWHSSLVLTVTTNPTNKDSLSLLVKASYLLGWVLQCLTLCPPLTHTPKSSKSRRKSVAALSSKLATLLDHVCAWLFKSESALHSCMEIHKVPELRQSLWVTMEMAMDTRVKIGGHPDRQLDMLREAVQTAECHLAERWLLSTVLIACKYHKQSESSFKRHHPDLEQICAVILLLTKELIEAQSPERLVVDHPLLVSSLAAVIKCRPELVSSEMCKVLPSLEQATDSPMELGAILNSGTEVNYHQQIDMFNGLLDIVYLAVVFSAQTETAEPMDDESILMGASKAWARLSSLLTRLFQLLLTRTPHLNPLEHLISAREKAVPSNGLQDSVLCVIIKRLATAMREVLGMVGKEELSLIIEELSQMDSQDPVSVCTFCVSWKLILDSKLKQPCREGLRKHFSKVVLLCQSAAFAQTSSTPLVTGVVQLVTSLVSLPSQAGLDNQSVKTVLQMCSLLREGCFNIQKMKFLQAMTEMVMCVCKQHSSGITRAPAPIITVLIKLIHEVVASGQDLEEQMAGSSRAPSTELSIVLQCASHVSRSLDILSQQVVFCKCVTYIIHEFIVTAHSRPLHTQVKDSLLPGVFSLVRLVSPGDIAFLKTHMDPLTRDNCQTLLNQYKQYYRFGGKV